MITAFMPKEGFSTLLQKNWKSGVTVALISIPLSIALSIASGAGPIPGIITGVWATLIAAIFGGNNYNIIGAAGALTTVLFAATLSAPLGLGALALPLIAISSGAIILLTYLCRADRFLYYIPGSVMYGFASGVAIAIAASQLFDASGLSALKRTGTFIGDIALFSSHIVETGAAALITFTAFLAGILVWKRFLPRLPAVIPAAVIGVAFGWLNAHVFHLDIMSLGEKFGGIDGALFIAVPWRAFSSLVASPEHWSWLLTTAGTVALISILETLITAKLADRIKHEDSSSRKELFGLALANIGSGIAGGLPATGVFIRTGANIKAGATHRLSAAIAAAATATIALLVLPAFAYIPMPVIAAILVNTAIGLIEVKEFKTYWKHERASFFIAFAVAAITVLEDAGTGVIIGAIAALLLFVDSISRGRFDAIYNYANGEREEVRGSKVLSLPPDKKVHVLSYSIAGIVSYIEAERHAKNLREAANARTVKSAIIRLRNLYVLDYEGAEMLAEAALAFERARKPIVFSSASERVKERIRGTDAFSSLKKQAIFTSKTAEALEILNKRS